MATVRAHRGKMPRLHDTVTLVGDVTVVGDVEIGEQSSIWFGAVVRGDVCHVRIGCRTNVQDCSVIHVTRETHPTIVGDDVTLGHRVTLHGCTVRNRVLVGIGAIVMDGAVVEDDAMVGAGAVVPPGMVVPSGMLALGSPARVKRVLTPEEVAYFRKAAQSYATLALQYRQEGWPPR
jgi:carbonic anhydrase/acetyltransferase-like protein (isoleucine patch superfamily)